MCPYWEDGQLKYFERNMVKDDWGILVKLFGFRKIVNKNVLNTWDLISLKLQLLSWSFEVEVQISCIWIKLQACCYHHQECFTGLGNMALSLMDEQSDSQVYEEFMQNILTKIIKVLAVHY